MQHSQQFNNQNHTWINNELLLLTLWRVEAYFFPGFPRPTINQGSFFLGCMVGDAAVVMKAEEFWAERT